MFDIGFWELALCAVVALLVVGPERLPRMAREAGIWVGRIRRYVQHVRDDIEAEIRNEGLKELMQKPPGLHDLDDLANETRESLEQARDVMEGARRDVEQVEESSSAALDQLDEADTGESRVTRMFEQAAPSLDDAPGDAAAGDAPSDDVAPSGEIAPSGEAAQSGEVARSGEAAPAAGDAPPAEVAPATDATVDEATADEVAPAEAPASSDAPAAATDEKHEPQR